MVTTGMILHGRVLPMSKHSTGPRVKVVGINTKKQLIHLEHLDAFQSGSDTDEVHKKIIKPFDWFAKTHWIESIK